MPYKSVDLTRVTTYPLPKRMNRVNLEDLISPSSPYQPFDHPELQEVANRIIASRSAGRPLIWMMGAHLVKRGLSPIVIDLMEKGVITHIASNGAATIHDFEIAFQGHTSEDVAASLADGSFGMAEETGAMMNQAIRQGAQFGIGLGEALGRWISEHETSFPYRDKSIVFTANRLKIPYTVHIAIGTDIIHQHPLVDFAAAGWTSGHDFKIFTAAVCGLEGGVFCNFGSAVIGPEVFLKAISIARNLGNTVKVFTTANFDLIDLGDYRKPIGDDQTDYYYRPRKNIVNRPVMLGGRGFHICGDHRSTIPTLYHQIVDNCPPGTKFILPVNARLDMNTISGFASDFPAAAKILAVMESNYPQLSGLSQNISAAFRTLLRCFITGGIFFIGGNGGSMADAIHIAGELVKSFKLPRQIPLSHHLKLSSQPGGADLADHLQQGFRTVVLGCNLALSSAVENDSSLPHISFAQELYVLSRPGDVFLGISTSGKAVNVNYAADVAKAMGLYVIALTGQSGSPLSEKADIAVCAPGSDTAAVQNNHVIIYHILCEMLEAQMYPGGSLT
jgi:phosphoheptose isomerase